MKVTNKKFRQEIEETIINLKEDLRIYRVDAIEFSYVNIKKNRNKEKYDVVVSIDDAEVPLVLVKDIIEKTCEELNIPMGKIVVEL